MTHPEEEIKTFAVAYRFEEELGLPSGFLKALGKEDDWSFVIKMHALFEAALTHVIVHRLGHDALDGPLTRMAMSGKIEFAAALDIINSLTKQYITVLSQFRNKCAHNVREAATFNLRQAVEAMDKNQKANFVKAILGPAGADSKEEEDHKQVVLRYPKLFLWHAGIAILARLSLTKQKDTVERELVEQEKRLLDSYMELDAAFGPEALKDIPFDEG